MQPLKVHAQQLVSGTSAPDISTLAKRFNEPPAGEAPPAQRLAVPKPTLVQQARRLPATQAAAACGPSAPAAAPAKPRRKRKALVSAAAASVLIPLAALFVWLWQDDAARHAGDGAGPVARLTEPNQAVQTADQPPKALEVALSSPEHIESNAGARIAFPVVIDATAALPVGSIVTVAALPAGASLSSGRLDGDGRWSLRPDEVGDLSLQLPAQSGVSAIRLALVGGDGTVLAQSETRLSVTPPPVAAAPLTGEPVAALATAPSEPVAAIATEPTEPVAAVETTGAIASVPPPDRKPTAAADSAVKVNKVKAVTIPAPRASRPHDGAYALAPAQDDPQASGEWMVTKTTVDMHAKALQSSETVKVAEKGLKMRVTARDKNWIQVHDPKSSTTGWIYNRFLTPADPPAQ